MPAAEPTAAAQPTILVAYADAGCLGSANLSAADADLPYFGGQQPASGAASWLFRRVGGSERGLDTNITLDLGISSRQRPALKE